MENNKPIKAGRLAASYAGFYLGAGFLSGQELWQFFGVQGIDGLWGIGLTVLFLALLGSLLFYVAKNAGITDFSKAVIRFESPAARAVFTAIEIFFTFAVFVVMAAGGGALVKQQFGISAALGSAVFCAAVAVVSVKGIDGMVSALSMLVPALTLITLAISIMAAVNNGGEPIYAQACPPHNPLMSNWLLSALTYISYNFFGAVCVFVPVADRISDKTARLGTAMGSGVLAVIAFPIFFTLAMNHGATSAQLPMLAVANGISPILGSVCAVPLLLGMFGTSLSASVAVLVCSVKYSPAIYRRCEIFVAILAALAWGGSLFGFSRLISVLYPLCGFLGFASIALLIEHGIYLRRKIKSVKNT